MEEVRCLKVKPLIRNGSDAWIMGLTESNVSFRCQCSEARRPCKAHCLLGVLLRLKFKKKKLLISALKMPSCVVHGYENSSYISGQYYITEFYNRDRVCSHPGAT